MPYEAEGEAAVEAALRAGAFIRSKVGQLGDRAIREKGTHDLVTVVDEESQQRILSLLTEAFPAYGRLAEEGDTDVTTDSGYRWIIDPVDGTTNFIHGLPPFAVSIALQKDDEIVVGVVYEVGRNELFHATRGSGLFLNGRRCKVSTEADIYRSLVTTGFPFRDHTYTYVDAYLDVLRTFMKTCQGVRRPGSAAADLAYVACGRCDGFFEIGLSPWDIAAGWLLVEEGGGRVSNFSGTTDDFLFGRQFLASNGILHDPLQAMVQPLRDVLAEVPSVLPS